MINTKLQKVAQINVLATKAEANAKYTCVEEYKHVHNHSSIHLSTLLEVRGHDNDPTLPVIDHLPEVSAGALHRTLSDDVRILLLVALHKIWNQQKQPLVNTGL